MRTRRFSFVAGWVAVAVLAVAGFAAFGIGEPSPEEVKAEAAAASIGHTAGAYAGLTFARLSSKAESAVLTATVLEEVEPAAGDDTDVTADTVVATTAVTIEPGNGWLSEVEVRALASLYFEPTDVNKAVRIAWCESRFDPDAVDLRTGGVGLYNHLPRYWTERAINAGFPGADATDPEASTAAAAWEVYHGAGWEIFNCR